MKDDVLFLLTIAVWGLIFVTLIGTEAAVVRGQTLLNAPVRSVSELGVTDNSERHDVSYYY